MNKNELIKKIMQKKELSQLAKKDVERVFSRFDNEKYSDIEKVKLTREILNKVFWGFRSQKLLSPKNKREEWILRKHLSTRERLPYYSKVYNRIFGNLKKASVIDLGAGVNGVSYLHFPLKVDYVGVEAVGQLVKLVNQYFKKKKLKAEMYHFSLFELNKIKKVIKKTKKPRVVFLFKVLDSLEIIERDYSKKLLKEIMALADKVVVSFATKSMAKREKFKVSRKWLLDFIKQRFKILHDFEIGGERYLILGR
jgi:hypothetical protein